MNRIYIIKKNNPVNLVNHVYSFFLNKLLIDRIYKIDKIKTKIILLIM